MYIIALYGKNTILHKKKINNSVTYLIRISWMRIQIFLARLGGCSTRDRVFLNTSSCGIHRAIYIPLLKRTVFARCTYRTNMLLEDIIIATILEIRVEITDLLRQDGLRAKLYSLISHFACQCHHYKRARNTTRFCRLCNFINNAILMMTILYIVILY